MPRFTPHFALKIVFLLSPRTFSQALTLGAILAATDPVAVVSALHELGAPGKLSVLIDGESLLNDGTAMVFFLIFNDMGFEGASTGYLAGGMRFLRLAIGGPLVGEAFFLLLWKWFDYHDSSVSFDRTAHFLFRSSRPLFLRVRSSRLNPRWPHPRF